VRLVRGRGGAVGIGFLRNQLVQFFQSNRGAGVIHPVTLPESVFVLRDLAEFECQQHPDVESHSLAWRRWVRMLVQ
jgi:hypothetical protein